MSQTAAPDAARAISSALAEETVALVRQWLQESAKVPTDKAAARLAGLLKDSRGLSFTVGFIDGVIRPEDHGVAARNFRVLSREVPRFLPWHLRAAVRLGGAAAPLAPRLVIPVVRRALRSMVGHLIVDATDRRLAKTIARHRRNGARLNINLLGEAVLGHREADRRLEGTHALLARGDVDYVSIKVSSTVAPHGVWAFDEAVSHIVESLAPLYERAAATPTPKFINLDMEEYRDLDLTIAVFTTILDRPGLLDLEAGIVLQAYLPEALGAMQGLQEWAARRRRRGGAAIKVRVVKGANLPMERVEASLHDWPLATWGTKRETDTNYKRVLSYALDAERIAERTDRRRGTQPLRPRLRLAPGGGARCPRRHGDRDASRDGPGPGRGRPPRSRAGYSSTRPSCTRTSSTSRSPTWSVASRRERATTTSCLPCSTCTTTRRSSSVRSSASSPP